MLKYLTLLALLFSTVALLLSVWTYQQADARAEAALKRREKAIVDKHRPAVERLCKDMGLKRPRTDAETLDELVEPLARLLEPLDK
jgi:hypothetical protein